MVLGLDSGFWKSPEKKQCAAFKVIRIFDLRPFWRRTVMALLSVSYALKTLTPSHQRDWVFTWDPVFFNDPHRLMEKQEAEIR